MPRILRNLKINEVSGVDRGAGRGVKIMLMKRDGDDETIDWDTVKREFSSKERESAADRGQALPDGSFPIKSTQDLKNAIQAIGRAKNPAKAKAHIKSRARALGESDLIPDTWKRDNDVAALRALNESIASIIADETVTDKVAKIDESIAQFNEFIQEETTDMTAEEMQKALDTAVAKAIDPLKGEIAKRDDEIAVLKMSEKARKYHDGLKDEDAKKAFRGKKPEDQEDEAEKAFHPAVDKRDADIAKALKAKDDEIAELRKMVGPLINEKRESEFRKRAVDAGLKETDGTVMLKAFDGDVDSQHALTKRVHEELSALRAQLKTNVIFKEFGSALPGSGDAYSELEAKAADLRKADPKLTAAQAFAKVYQDPANRELVDREKIEKTQKLAKVAAGTGI